MTVLHAGGKFGQGGYKCKRRFTRRWSDCYPCVYEIVDGENVQNKNIMLKRSKAHTVAKSHRTSNYKELIRWANNDGILRK